MSEGGEGNIRFIKGAAYMREREREGNIRFIKGAAFMRERERDSIRLIAVCVCKNLLFVCYRLTSKAKRRQCQSQSPAPPTY